MLKSLVMLTSTDYKDVASQMRPIEGRYRSVGIIGQVISNFKIQKLVLAVISVNSISIIRKFIMFGYVFTKIGDIFKVRSLYFTKARLAYNVVFNIWSIRVTIRQIN